MSEKLLKVTFEFETYIQTLEGKQAQAWVEAVNGPIILQQLRGYPNKELDKIKWTRTEKKS